MKKSAWFAIGAFLLGAGVWGFFSSYATHSVPAMIAGGAVLLTGIVLFMAASPN